MKNIALDSSKNMHIVCSIYQNEGEKLTIPSLSDVPCTYKNGFWTG